MVKQTSMLHICYICTHSYYKSCKKGNTPRKKKVLYFKHILLSKKTKGSDTSLFLCCITQGVYCIERIKIIY